MINYFKIFFAFIISSLLISCGPGGTPTAEVKSEKLRFGVASFNMETCTFCPRPTGIEEFEYYGPPLVGNDVLDYAPGGTKGFMLAAADFDDIEVVGIYSTRSPLGGSSGGTVTREAFEKYAGEIVNRFAADKDIDGIYLPLHGAMAVDGIEKPEAELVRRIRAVVGPDIPIAVTMDLHGNEDHELSDVANFVMATKRYPHYDHNLNGERSARLLRRYIKGSYKPTMAARKPGVTFATVFGATCCGAPQDVMERARRWQNRNLDVYVTVFWGFTFADVEDGGVAVFVLTNDDQDLAERIADDMNQYILDRKEDFEVDLPVPANGVPAGLQAVIEGRGPVVLANHSDRLGDATYILKELMNNDATNYAIATLRDEKVVAEVIANNKVGDKISVNVGGFTTEMAGPPVNVKGTVHFIGKFGNNPKTIDDIVVIRFGPKDNNYLILTPSLHQVITRPIFDATNVPLDDLDMIAIKSRVHYKRGFIETRMFKEAIVMDAPGHGQADISKYTYKKLPKDIWSKHLKKEPIS